MGTNYYVMPLGQDLGTVDRTLRTSRPWLADEIDREGGLTAWSGQRGVTLPAGARSRFPTSREVATVVESLAGLRYQVSLGWITVFTYLDDREHTYIASYGFKGGLDDPWPFFFEKGSVDLARFLTARIAAICGPLLFQPDDYRARLELIEPHVLYRFYGTTSGSNGRTLVQWTNPMPQYTARESRLLPFPEPDDDSDGYNGLPAFVDAHGIPFPRQVTPGHLLSGDDIIAALTDVPAYQTVFHQDWETEALTADVYKGTIDADHLYTSMYCQYSWPHETWFTAGTLLAQVTVAEEIARRFGPYALLPSYLSPIPILVLAGDNPAELLAAWEQRSRSQKPS